MENYLEMVLGLVCTVFPLARWQHCRRGRRRRRVLFPEPGSYIDENNGILYIMNILSRIMNFIMVMSVMVTHLGARVTDLLSDLTGSPFTDRMTEAETGKMQVEK